jgi:predicted permease
VRNERLKRGRRIKMTSLINNIRYGLRQIRRSPGFSATVILTMALGVGANVVVFSVLNALVLKPLDLPGFDRLMFIDRHANANDTSPSQSYPDYRDVRDKNVVFSGVAASRVNQVGVEHDGTATKSWMYEASDNYFDVLGVKPVLGRFFHNADDHGPNSSPYAVLSYDFWQTHLNGDAGIVGKVINLNKHPYTVLGVAPKGFQGTELFFRPDLWVPMLNEAQLEGYSYLESRGDHGIWLVGRLKPGVTVAAADANLNAIAQQLRKQYTEDDGLTYSLSRPGFLGDLLGGPVRKFLFGVMLLAGLVLLAACANLGSLFAARAADRARELALRMALGSTRGHILRQLVTEALLLALLGGALGVGVGSAMLKSLSRWRPSADFPVQLNVTADSRTFLLALGLAVVCGVFFGLVPATQVWRSNAYQAIKGGQSGVAGSRRWTLRDVLLMVQIVLCSVLVTSSLVAIRGLTRSFNTSSYGFQPEGVTMASFDLGMAGYTAGQSTQFQRRVLEAAQKIPGVTAAGIANTTPLSLDSSDSYVFRDGTTDFHPSKMAADANFYDVSPGYLGTAQTRLLEGRDFTWHDDDKAPKVAIVNETFAKKVFGTSHAVGKHFIRDSRYEVIGVVEEGKYGKITEDPTAAMFFSAMQNSSSETVLLVRSRADEAQTAGAVQRLLTSMDVALPFTISSWEQALGVAQFPAVAATFALGIMGLLAAMLAVTGIFGMASYSVSRRLREMGIRMALGAQRTQVLRAALGRPMLLLVLGSLGGLLVGGLSGKVLASIVYQATPRDPLVLLGVLVSMSLIGLVAAWIPARRALAVEPSMLLREE